MITRRGYTLIEIVLVIATLGIIAIVALPRFIDTSSQAVEAQEDGVVGAVRSGIDVYGSKSLAQARTPTYPETLDSAADGEAAAANPFFGTIIYPGIINDWDKGNLSYVGPTGQLYNYDPTLGTFKRANGPAGSSGIFSFEEGGGSTVGGGDLTGTFHGGVSFEGGIEGEALDFDGSDAYVSIPDSEAVDLTDAGTLAAWINYDDIQNYDGIIHKGDQGNFSDEAYTLQFWNNDRLRFAIVDNSGGYHIIDGSTQLQTGEWYHVTANWDENGMNIYLNGQLEASSGDAVVARNTDGSLNIGAQIHPLAYGGYGNFTPDGRIDEVGVYDRALTQGEIQLLMGEH